MGNKKKKNGKEYTTYVLHGTPIKHKLLKLRNSFLIGEPLNLTPFPPLSESTPNMYKTEIDLELNGQSQVKPYLCK